MTPVLRMAENQAEEKLERGIYRLNGIRRVQALSMYSRVFKTMATKRDRTNQMQ